MRQDALGHLGGYVPGGDPATYYPDLWNWLVEVRGVRSVIDVGCGDGVALDYFERAGCSVMGVDGVPQDDPRIVRHDYTEGAYRPPGRFDLAWCCEFVEHVDERHRDNFLPSLLAADTVLLTHAMPGQPGHHHVNCQPAEYWLRWLEGAGLRYDPSLTHETRRLARLNENRWNHYARSGLALVK